MEFKKVAELFQKIEDISSRLEMMEILGDFYKECDPQEAAIVSYMILGRIAPMFIPAEFNFSEKSVLNTLKSLVDISSKGLDVVRLREELGDIGLVAEKASETIGSTGNDNFNLIEVYDGLWKLLNISGNSSVDRKSSIFGELFKSTSPIEIKYLSRLVSGKMRLGASVSTILEALSYSREGDKSMVESLKQSYGSLADIGVLSYRVVGGKKIEEVTQVTIGIPIKSRLVERVKRFDEVFDRLGEEFILQPKFDGLRCQGHVGVDYEGIKKRLKDAVWVDRFDMNSSGEDIGSMDMFGAPATENSKEIELFSRNLETTTEMFPEIADALRKLDCENCILDGEIEGVNPETGEFLNFQETITRKRKYGVEDAVDNVPVKFYVFDIMYLNGRDLTEVDTAERIEVLNKLMSRGKPELVELAETRRVNDLDEVMEFFNESVGGGLEGLVAKQLKGGYRAGVRNYEWIKLKKSMDKELVDSVDLVIMGYYYGSGRQAQLGIGALLGGILNDKTGEIETITKIGTGITEDQWKVIFERLNELKVNEMPKEYIVADEMKPDVWVTPEVVCSVEADEVTKSKLHKAGAGESDDGLGLALRFPRLIEFDRDKGVEDVSRVGEIG